MIVVKVLSLMMHKIIGLFFIPAAFFLDQWSKNWILGRLETIGSYIDITSFLKFILVMNEGVSFSLFSGWISPFALIVLASGIVLGLFYWLLTSHSALVSIGLGLMVGGALGNIYDRIRYDAVVDFIRFYLPVWYWPTFNVADIFVCIGGGLILLEGWKKKDVENAK